MTGKAAFTPEEWETVLHGPPTAALMVITAQRGGTFRETFALTQSYVEARKQHGQSELLDEVVSARPEIDRTRYASADGVSRGAYVLADARDGKPEVILLATGSEVALCTEVYETLTRDGVAARVVSMPSWELFEQQDRAYRDSVLPPHVTARVAVEQASVIGWDRYVGVNGTVIGMHTFGSSAPLKDLLTKFGFVPQKVLEAAKAQLAGDGRRSS